MKLVRSPALSSKAITALKQRNRQGAPLGNIASLLTTSRLVIACTFTFGIVNTQAAGLAGNALPTGGQVAAGQATINQSGNTMNINQSTQRAVINWNSFNVGANSTVNFNQPNANSSTLNRVNSASKSMINGAVNSNGQVIFVNPNGVVFGKGAEVNTGGIVATTMNISDADYMAGKSTYSGGETGKVINKGTITVNNINGYIALMAPEVKNEGVLIANLSGNNAIALVSGQQVTLSISGSQLINVTVDASVINSLISNKRLIKTDGGQVIIAANSASDLRSSAMNNTGIISASAVKNEGGRVFLTAGTVNQSGTVSANSAQANGGEITISGNLVNLNSTSKTTATGASNGGQILVGKTAQNTALSQVNANTVNIVQGALVDASSTQNGNGGSISIWSQIATNIAGVLKATGGMVAGNGGNIETSSAGVVTYGKGLVVDTSAPHGKFGNWLTDPDSITIGDSDAADALSTALGMGNVTLNATVNITFSFDMYSANPFTSLTLIAQGGIDVSSNITAGAVYAVAQAINVNSNGSINTNGGINGNIYLAGAIINILGNIGSNGNSSNNTSSNSLNQANINLTNQRQSWVSGGALNGLSADTTIYTSNGGNINIIATSDINIGSSSDVVNLLGSRLAANGLNGGSINIISVNGNINNYGVIDAVGNGSNGTGGVITIAAKNLTTLSNAQVSVDGYTQGGVIQIGIANGVGSGLTSAPPSINTQVATLLTAANFTPSSTSNILSSNTLLDNVTNITANAKCDCATDPLIALNSHAGQIYIAGNNSLDISAYISASSDNGGLIILSSPSGTYQNSGSVMAGGYSGLGGTIAQSGLTSTNIVNATIGAGGSSDGNIIIGRDFKSNPLPASAATAALLPPLSLVVAVPTSESTHIDSSHLTSDTNGYGNSGNGGNILIWGATNTISSSYLYASANGTSGNAGLIATSGNVLTLSGNTIVSTGAGGIPGTWFIEANNFSIGGPNPNISANDLGAVLASTSVAISTIPLGGTGVISVNNDIHPLNNIGTSSLTLTADSIYLESGIEINTGGNQTYNGGVTLLGDIVSFYTNNLTFNSRVGGGQLYFAQSGNGILNLNGIVDGLEIINTNVGVININTSNVTTGQSQNYCCGSVVLGADTTLTGNGINFAYNIVGPHALTIHDSSADTRFYGRVGGSIPLSSLNVTSSGIIFNPEYISGPFSIATVGSQIYNGAITLGANTTLTGNGITFNSTIDASSAGAQSLNISDRGTTNFNGVIGSTASLSSLNVTSDAGININNFLSAATMDLETTTGNIILAGNLSASSNASNAIVINAGNTLSKGSTTTGSDIQVIGNPTIEVGSGGSAMLFTGTLEGSRGVASLVPVGHFRYNSTATSSGYDASTAPLSSGVNLIYREQPIITIAADNASMVYGATSLPTFSTNMSAPWNGDSALMITGGTLQTTANLYGNVGSYSIVPSGYSNGLGALGYGLALTNGAFTITPATLTYTATPTTSSYGNAPSVNAGTVTGFVNNDTLASATGGAALFATSATATSSAGNYAITGSGLTANNGNYLFVQAPSNSTALTIKAPLASTYVPIPLNMNASSSSSTGASTSSLGGVNTSPSGGDGAEIVGAPSDSNGSLMSGIADTSSSGGDDSSVETSSSDSSSSSSSKNGSTAKEKKSKKDSKAMTAKERQNTFITIPSPGFYGSSLVKGQERYALLPDENGKVGAITVTIGTATSLINNAYVSVNVDGKQAPIFDTTNRDILKQIYQNIQQGVPQSAAQ
ncbi:S-layer family protein [Polynucleobacter sp. JS-Fieb-80-E5]|uniref:beta strand repeat-containing protein n=1 Tax=Polynucleobacter sp. JS-Fieb-80-E5 TaxID=2081050 RepID=UPI001C0B942B|nr:filamentous hemagglutinin N-terminal domain-containing protein [Polynucleobacter sp. JS-Fieb-80-E5]MBU3617842.1 filamentous hemagglutinin N-terminal domain-containing protein [Polynucleobacter sp. JS-Fieb-80-E5]